MLQHHIKDEAATFFYSHTNPPPMVESAGLIDQHSRDLHNALVASINNSVALNKSITPCPPSAIATSPLQQQQQQPASKNVIVSCGGGGTGKTTTLSGRSTPTNNNNNGAAAAAAADAVAPGKLFVGGLSWQTTSEKLKEYFNMFGTVTDVLIMRDPVTQRSRGFGFITFKEPNSASVDKVLKVPIHTLDGKKIDPKHATPKNRPRQANKTKKIFVGGVSQETSAEEVKAYFNQFGTVEETVMLMDQQTKRHRGFGFVTFENEDVVDRVCEIHFHTIKNKKVECKKAQPKEAVTPAAQLLQKRLMFGTLGVRLPTVPGQLVAAGPGAAPVVATVNPLALLQSQQAAQAHAAQAAMMHHNPFSVQNTGAAAAAAAAANPGYGKLLAAYPQTALHSLRYTPYPIPASAAAAVAAAQQQQQQQQHQHQQHSQHHQQQQAAAVVATAAANQHSAAAANQALSHAAAAAAAPVNAANQHQAQVAAAAAQQAALVATYPMNAHHPHAAAAAAAAAASGNPYQSFALANVDMSSFQGVDWGSMYGMGMYG